MSKRISFALIVLFGFTAIISTPNKGLALTASQVCEDQAKKNEYQYQSDLKKYEAQQKSSKKEATIWYEKPERIKDVKIALLEVTYDSQTSAWVYYDCSKQALMGQRSRFTSRETVTPLKSVDIESSKVLLTEEFCEQMDLDLEFDLNEPGIRVCKDLKNKKVELGLVKVILNKSLSGGHGFAIYLNLSKDGKKINLIPDYRNGTVAVVPLDKNGNEPKNLEQFDTSDLVSSVGLFPARALWKAKPEYTNVFPSQLQENPEALYEIQQPYEALLKALGAQVIR